MSEPFIERTTTKIGSFIVVSIMIAGGLMVMEPRYLEWKNHGPSQKFDRSLWKEGEDRNNPVRIRMIGDLLCNYKLKGKTMTQIQELLGDPSSVGLNGNEYFCYLGKEGGLFSIDDDWLDLKFKNNIVVDVDKHPD